MIRALGAALLPALLFGSADGFAAPRDARVPGGVAVIPLAPDAEPRPGARFAGQAVLVDRRNGRWLAFVGLALDLEPGRQHLELADGRRIEFEIMPKHYPEQHLVLSDRSRVDLSAESAARAEREIGEIRRLKQHRSEEPEPDLDLARPAAGRHSAAFGARRYFNGQARAPHVGLDLAVPVGTPVRAGGRGTVLATGDYFFNGKTVFIDHGQGLISMLCHLDRIDVRVGERVDRQRIVGRSGKSGRASGPHLHWSVILNGAMVDPELFLGPPR